MEVSSRTALDTERLDLAGCDRIVVREFNMYDDLIAEYQVGEDWTGATLDPDCEYFTLLAERRMDVINYN